VPSCMSSFSSHTAQRRLTFGIAALTGAARTGQAPEGAVVDWIERVTKLRRFTRGDERAAHKPLLLLYAVGRFQRYGDAPIGFNEAEEDLGGLLKEFGPPRKTSPAYPFHHLATDGVWTVSTTSGPGSPGASVTALRSQHAEGRLAPALVDSLRAEPPLLSQLAHAVLEANFEPSLHEDICAAAGLDLEAADSGTGREGTLRRRDPEFRRSILIAYEFKCAFCGFDGLLDGSLVALEAAHVRWWTHDGPNEVGNGLCLCSIHHKLFDKGVLGVTSTRKITVSARFIGRSKAADLLVISLSGQDVSLPLRGFPAVAAHHATWHTREVFRSPARAF
jgi:putative restriction endonuclease